MNFLKTAGGTATGVIIALVSVGLLVLGYYGAYIIMMMINSQQL